VSEIESQRVCRQTVRHTEHVAVMDREDVDQHSSTTCTEEITLASDDDSINIPQGTKSCCFLAPQAEAQKAEVLLLNPVNAENVLPAFDDGALIANFYRSPSVQT
jgi:hypothetical protein